MRYTDHPDTMTVGEMIARDGGPQMAPFRREQEAIGVEVAHALCRNPGPTGAELRERAIAKALGDVFTIPGQEPTRLDRLESIQTRLRRRWQRAISAADFKRANLLVRRLHRVTLALWAEKAVSP